MSIFSDKAGLVMNEVTSEMSSEALRKTKGLGIFTAAVFIIGEMAGSGILSLPDALLLAGWSGIALIIFCAVLSGYTGVILGRSWQILKDRFPKYQEDVRYPYPAIGYEVAGIIGRCAVTFCVNATLFSVSCVFLLVSADNVMALLKQANVHISFCVWIPVIAAVLCPFTWLGTPKDFWPIAAGAALSTGLACILIVVQEVMDIGVHQDVGHPAPTFISFFSAFGVILFAFGGHAIFPTVQHDMKDTRKFHWTVGISYAVVLLYYLPVSIAGYAVYGDVFITEKKDNILDVMSPSTITTIVTVMITAHLMMGFIIVINPFCQEVEELLSIPPKFGIKRVLLRTAVVAIVLFVAESVPTFEIILGLVGGSTVTLLTFVFPSLFYILLRRQTSEVNAWNPDTIHLLEYILNGFIIGVGLFGGAASTYSAIDQIVTGEATFALPCYVKS